MTSEEIAFNPSYCYSKLQPYFYYAVGNTPAKDLTEGCPVPDEAAFLLLGCGDIRNILFTTAECSHLKRIPRVLEFNINDVDEVCLARDVVLLTILDSINPEIPDDVEFLWSVWYNLHIERNQHERLNCLMKKYLENGSDLIKFPDNTSQQTIQKFIRQWATLSLSCKEISEVRKKSILRMSQTNDFEKALSSISWGNANVQLPEESATDEKWRAEVENYFRNGSCWEHVGHEGMSVNPTFWCPQINDWRVHYASNPFQSYNILL